MTIRDTSDEEIAREVLKRLEDRGLRSLRQQEDVAPVSRTTLGHWRNGRYEMKGPTRKAALEWLGKIQPAPEGLTERQEKLIVANWLERLASDLRREATAPNEGMTPAERDVLYGAALGSEQIVRGTDTSPSAPGSPPPQRWKRSASE